MSQHTDPINFSFSTSPERYRHLKLEINGDQAMIKLGVDPEANLRGDTPLKLNSYDLGVDIELADCINRLRFCYPQIRVCSISSANQNIFSAGANIYMLKKSSHAFKVNFCKYTNETRLYMEEASRYSGLKFLAALNGTAAGGGYELALACDRIILIDDKNANVSLPEVPLLGVLPGTGGLTRLVDKRQVRRDLADVFSTLVEGVKGHKAKDWGLVDEVYTKSEWQVGAMREAEQLKSQQPVVVDQGISWPEINPQINQHGFRYKHVSVELGMNRVAKIHITGPAEPEPNKLSAMMERGADLWLLRAFRELDDAILRLRFFYRNHGLWLLESSRSEHILSAEQPLYQGLEPGVHWFLRELCLHVGRVFKRLDTSSRSIMCMLEPDSAFVGVLAELLLVADRSYALLDPQGMIALSPMNTGLLATWFGQSRMALRFMGQRENLAQVINHSDGRHLSIDQAYKLGLLTFASDYIDFPDQVRLSIEERVALSPDALIAMEANLRFIGAETMATKIFGRLSAWQNWVFIRENATGPQGALSSYGEDKRAAFDFERC